MRRGRTISEGRCSKEISRAEGRTFKQKTKESL